MRLAIIFSLFALSLCALQSGLRLDFSSSFLKQTTQSLFPKIFKMIHDMLKPPNNMTLDLSFFPFNCVLEIINATSTILTTEQNAARIEIAPRNQAIFAKMPIKKWNIAFKYKYSESGKTVEGKANFTFDGFDFELEFKPNVNTFGSYVEFLAIYLDMNNSGIHFDKKDGWLGRIMWLVNDMKKTYQFVLNYFGRDLINLAMRIMSGSIPIPLFLNYALDMAFGKSLKLDSDVASLYLKGDIFNTKKKIRSEITPSKALDTIKSSNKTLRFMLNDFPFNSLFASMSKSNELFITLTDADVFRWTKFLHLRTSVFKYYIPGLLSENGDTLLDLKVSGANELPKMELKNKELRIIGPADFDFIVKGKSNIKLRMLLDVSLTILTEQMKMIGKINGIGLKKLDVISCAMKKENCNNDAEKLKNEFNILFKFVTNGVNLFMFDSPIPIPSEIPLGFVTLLLSQVDLALEDGVLLAGANLKIKQ